MSHDELQRHAASLHVAARTHTHTQVRGFAEGLMKTLHLHLSPLIFTGQKFLNLGQNRGAKVQFP